MTTTIERVANVSRRSFIQGIATTGAFVVAARVLPESVWAQQTAVFRTQADGAPLNPSVYLGRCATTPFRPSRDRGAAAAAPWACR
jgi:hypothetical protein